MSASENSKRIAKNTAALYIRMMFVMLVSLYTSREILLILGVENFGIYNLVASVVVLFSFFNSALTSASQRYLNIALASGDAHKVQRVFSASLNLYIGLVVLIAVLSETFGLWFIQNKLDIPLDRSYSALVTYHIAILTTCVSIMKVPYNALIIANEKMSFFAYTGVVEVVLKLVIVWMVLFIDSDKLISYSVLLLGVNIFLFVWYFFFCAKNYPNAKFILKTEKRTVVEMSQFSGWTILGTLADVSFKQGTNFIINIFCGVTLNATMGIVNQIRGAVFSFIGNLQVAANPQIVKSYAMGDDAYFRTLVCRISKYSYFLMFVICIPIMLNSDYLLHVWLETPPAYAVLFTNLVLAYCLIDSLTGPLWTSMQAGGDIKSYQIFICVCLLSNLPISYIILDQGGGPEWILIVQIIINIVTLVFRLLFSNKYVRLPIGFYLKKVALPIILVSVVAFPIPYWLSLEYSGIACFFITGIASVVCSCFSIYVLGLDKSEKILIKEFIHNKFKK